VVVTVLALAGCSGDKPGVGPSASVPGPDDRVTLFGTSVYRGDSSFEDALARQDAAFGRLQVVRLFNTGDPPPWPGSPADTADRPVVVSFKLPPAEVISGLHDENLREWFASVPADHDVWWVYFHEPENDSEDGAFTPEQFREAFRHVSGLASEVDNPHLHSALILQCRTLNPDVGRSLADFDPGADSYDVLGFDCYNRQSDAYPAPEQWLAPIVAAAQERDRPWALGEFGSVLLAGDDGTARATWLGEVAAFAASQDVPFVTYFDSPASGTDYRLADEPSRAAWHHIVTGE
jgi:hypothetical protein